MATRRASLEEFSVFRCNLQYGEMKSRALYHNSLAMEECSKSDAESSETKDGRTYRNHTSKSRANNWSA